jgi:hypothetical protein
VAAYGVDYDDDTVSLSIGPPAEKQTPASGAHDCYNMPRKLQRTPKGGRQTK